MAENKQIPAIRFREFKEEWVEVELKDVSIYSNGGSFENQTQENGRYELITLKSIDMQGKLVSSGRYIDIETPTLKKDTLVMILSEQSPGLLGMTTLIPTDNEFVLNQRVAEIRPNKDISSYFLSMAINKNQYYFSRCGAGTKVQNISKPNVERYAFSCPQCKEQTQIGSYFQNLDKLISLHHAKVNKLANLKKAMLEKMFPKDGADVPEIRFKGFDGAWEKSRFGDCVLIQRGGSPRPIESFITNEENGINWIKIGDVSKASRYITKTKEKIIPSGEKYSRRVYAGDLILSNSMSFGRPYIMAIEGCIHDGWLVIRDENKLFNLEYLLQLLSSDFMLEQYKALASGGVVINLNSELVQSTTVYVPILAEQEKIGAYFQNLDNLIALHQTELDKLNNLKKACLEKMFV
ncbi:restriction endonuclease subunit S [Nitrosomonas sp. Is24]|uniref:restriction endonuclease subunit S n=1 Tax=Nitrosomonas sp. Is24 TaxID=3080533 RepID=UPI00294AECE8|nr:restriction endonuclease subunit S [Nitrosomonas sp. Is24]MDV6340156.1 restriction endonuclease subunit S [Nitrosomonas sp. Is24]